MIRSIIKTEIFEVYDVFKKDFIGSYNLHSNVKNFVNVVKGETICSIDMGKQILAEEDFIPILFGESRYTDILGFKAKKI